MKYLSHYNVLVYKKVKTKKLSQSEILSHYIDIAKKIACAIKPDAYHYKCINLDFQMPQFLEINDRGVTCKLKRANISELESLIKDNKIITAEGSIKFEFFDYTQNGIFYKPKSSNNKLGLSFEYITHENMVNLVNNIKEPYGITRLA